jgi:oleate hydratase
MDLNFPDLAIGSMTAPPKSEPARNGTSWMLWKTVAQRRPDFGQPEAFSNHADQSTLVSFTVTCTTPIFAKLMEDFSRREAGRGGLMTLKRSNWLISIAVFQQPIFVEQSREVYILWGYSFSPHNLGNFVGKSMTQCSGAEILYEVLKRLKFDAHLGDITNSSICIPCLMPYANSVMLRRKRADRPLIVPEGSTNFAFIGQFCEQSDDVVFTIEYSIRSAMTAVYKLLNLDKQPPPVYKGWRDQRVVYRVLKAVI